MMETQAGSKELVITRVFNAPRELVFKAWTELDRFTKWWGPQGFTVETHRFELRQGGMYLGSQRSPDGHVMWGKFVYREIEAPGKLVFIQSFSDEQGNTVRAPFSPIWPLEIINDLSLADKDGTTELTLRGGPINATDEEIKAYEGMIPTLQQGLGGTLDQLTDYLANNQ